MKVNVLDKVKDYEGKPAFNWEPEVNSEGKTGNKKVLLTWRLIIFTALNASLPDDQEKLTPEEKEKAYQITTKTYQSESPDFTVEERSFILENIAKVYNPLVIGRSKEVFEEKVQQEPKKNA